MESLTFGDIFRYNEKEYIFLAKTEERIYAAQILTPDKTSQIDKLFRLRQSKNQPTFQTIYCYVILQTESYKDRAAHFYGAGDASFVNQLEKLSVVLDINDLKAIKEEITKKSTISIELKELVKDLSV